MKEKIGLQSRSRIHNYLQLVDGKKYKLMAEYSDHIRVGYLGDNETIFFIDPPGGPMIQIGDVYESMKIKAINPDFTVEFE